MAHHSSRFSGSSITHIALIMLVAFLIRTFGYGLYRVPTGSMETTMLVGEFFFADKFSCLFRRPARGDIIAFNDPTYDYSHNPIMNTFQRLVWGPSSWTKRVIGIPGDHIEGKIENGRPVVYRNGIQLKEEYIDQHVAHQSNGFDEFSIKLGPRQYWVMGDNRCNSHDSRSFGPLDGNLIHGKIIFRIASIDNTGLLDSLIHPFDFWKSIRWERCAQRVV